MCTNLGMKQNAYQSSLQAYAYSVYYRLSKSFVGCYDVLHQSRVEPCGKNRLI